jgi:hypothetical protein
MADEVLDLKRFLSSMRLGTEVGEVIPMVQNDLTVVRRT